MLTQNVIVKPRAKLALGPSPQIAYSCQPQLCKKLLIPKSFSNCYLSP